MPNNFPHSLVVVAPVSAIEDLKTLGQALGVDGVLIVELSADGTEPATHKAAHTWASPSFVAIMTGKVYPPGVPQKTVDDMLSSITVSVDANGLTKLAHFNHVIKGMGLDVVESVEE